MLCENTADLCNSHALPDALFRPMLQQGNGSAIVTSDDLTTPISRSSDTWSTPQLCADCEKLLNEECDSYGLAIFKGKKGRAARTPAGVSLQDVDAGKLRMFLLSVLWRMSVSTHSSYLNAQVPHVLREELRATLLARGQYTASRLQVSLQRLHDSTEVGGITSEHFREVVMSPFIRKADKFYAVCFLIHGFLVQVYIPSLPVKFRRIFHVIEPRATVVFAPLLEFTKFPELFALGVRSLHKINNGLSRLPHA